MVFDEKSSFASLFYRMAKRIQIKRSIKLSQEKKNWPLVPLDVPQLPQANGKFNYQSKLFL